MLAMEGTKWMMDKAAALLAMLPPASLPSLVLRAMDIRRGGDPVIGPGLSWGVSGPGAPASCFPLSGYQKR